MRPNLRIDSVPYYTSKNGVIYHGDCLDILRDIEDDSVDLVLTDPPWGIGMEYDSYEDTIGNLERMISPFISECQRIAKVTFVSCGTKNIYRYPQPDHILAWCCPAGVFRGPYGFNCWEPILCYGSDPYLKRRLGGRPDAIVMTESCSYSAHPCAKPLGVWKWLLERGSTYRGDIVLDPFAGSGTTALAAEFLGRSWILIEKSKAYCDMAIERIKKWEDQARFSFIPEKHIIWDASELLPGEDWTGLEFEESEVKERRKSMKSSLFSFDEDMR